jgi:hypothetical protein
VESKLRGNAYFCHVTINILLGQVTFGADAAIGEQDCHVDGVRPGVDLMKHLRPEFTDKTKVYNYGFLDLSAIISMNLFQK